MFKRYFIFFICFFSQICIAEPISYSELLQKFPDYQNAIQQGIPRIVKTPSGKIQFEPVHGGFSPTQLFLFTHHDKKYVLRLLSKKHSAEETQATLIASKLGIAPKVVYHDPDHSIIIMDFIEGHTLTKADLENKNILKNLGIALRKMHHYQGAFAVSRTQVDRVKKHYSRSLDKQVAFPTIYKQLYEQYMATNTSSELVFSHGDLNASNIIVSGTNIYIIDWASATQSDPYMDLGYLTLLSGMNSDQQQGFLEAYFQHKPTPAELRQVCLAQKRTAFLTATTWFDFSESPEDQKIPYPQRVARLDELLSSPSLKTGKMYIQDSININPKTAPTKEIQLFALGFLKDYIHWKCE